MSGLIYIAVVIVVVVLGICSWYGTLWAGEHDGKKQAAGVALLLFGLAVSITAGALLAQATN